MNFVRNVANIDVFKYILSLSLAGLLFIPVFLMMNEIAYILNSAHDAVRAIFVLCIPISFVLLFVLKVFCDFVVWVVDKKSECSE